MNQIVRILIILCSVWALPAFADDVSYSRWKALFLRAWENRLTPTGLKMADSLYAEGVRNNDVQLQCRAAAVRTVYSYYNPEDGNLEKNIQQVRELSRKEKRLYPYYYFAGLFAVDNYLNHRHSIKAMRVTHLMELQAEQDELKYGCHCVHLANAKIYAHNGEYKKSLEQAGEAIKKASDANDLVRAYTCMVPCYMKMEQYGEAIDCTDKMYRVALNDVQRFMALQMKCQALYYARLYDDFRMCFELLEAVSRKLGNEQSNEMRLVHVYNYLITQQYDKATALIATLNDTFLADKIEVMKSKGNYGEALKLFMRRLRYNDSLSYANIYNDFDEIDNEVGNIAMRYKLTAAMSQNVHMKAENLRLEVINSQLELGRLKEENEIREEKNRKNLLMIKKNNAELEKLKAKKQMDKIKAEDRESEYAYKKNMLTVGIVALLLIIVLLVIYLWHRHKMEKSINAKNRELMDARRMLEESRERKMNFLKSISHEIRTPANAITGFIGVLTTPGLKLDAEELHDIKTRIKMNSRHLQTLVNDILDTKGLETGKIGIKLKEVNVNEVCRSALSFIKEQCDAKGVRLYFTSDVTDYTVVTDGRRLQQVLINYLTNAEKNTDSGYIRLSFSATESKEWVTFSVEDTGCGIPADKMDTLFRRFEKINQFTQGAGMGLYMCRIIADRLGGKAEVDRNYRNGARFMFKLKKAVILLLMMLCGHAVTAGAQVTDGDSEMLQIYNEAKKMLHTPDCITLADSLFNMAGRKNAREMQCLALYVHVAYALNIGDDEATFRYCDRLMNFAGEHGIRHHYYLAWYTRINRLFQTYRAIEALRELNAMRRQALTEDYKYGLARCYRAVGNIYMRNGDYSMALKNFMDELHTIEHADTRQDIGDVYEKIGSCQKYLGQYREAALTFDKAIKISTLPKVKSENKAWRGIVAFMLDDRDTFLRYYHELCADPLAMQTMAKIIVRQLNMFYCICNAQWAEAFEICNVPEPKALDYMLLSDYYYFHGDMAKALEMKEKRYVEERRRRTDSEREDVARHLAQITKDKMDIEKHQLERESYMLTMSNSKLNLNKMRLELESEKNKKHIEKVASDNYNLTLNEQAVILEQAQIRETTRLQEKELEDMRHKRNLAIMVTVICISFVLLTFLCYFIYNRHNSLAILRDKNRELESELEKIRHTDRLKEEFLSQMNNDVNQPLNAIVGFTELLVRDVYKDDEEGRQNAKEIVERSTQQLLDIVTDAVDKAME